MTPRNSSWCKLKNERSKHFPLADHDGNVAALSSRSYEDFEACSEYIDVQPGETATSSDGMFAVIIKT